MTKLKKETLLEDVSLYIQCSVIGLFISFIPWLSIIIRGAIWWSVCLWGLSIVVYNIKNKNFPTRNWFFWLAVFFVLALLATSIFNGAFLRFGLGYVLVGTFFLSCFLPNDFSSYSARLYKILISIMLVCISISLCFYILYICKVSFFKSLSVLLEIEEGRWNGLFHNSNRVGWVDELAILFSLLLIILKPSRKWVLLSVLTVLLACVELYLSNCRNAIISLAFAIGALIVCYFVFYYKFQDEKVKKLSRNIIIGFFIILIIACLIIFFGPLKQKFVTYFRFESGLSSREVLWDSGFAVAKNHLLFGDNQLEMMKHASEYAAESINDSELLFYIYDMDPEAGVHNSYLQVFMIGGLLTALPFWSFGIIFYIIGIIVVIKRKKVDSFAAQQILNFVPIFSMFWFFNFFESNAISSLTIFTLLYYFSLTKGILEFQKILKK